MSISSWIAVIMFFIAVFLGAILGYQRLREWINERNQPEKYKEQCTNHPNVDAVDICIQCGKNICSECAVFREEDEETYCMSCMDKLFPHV